jgi:hypothetical protein
VVLIGRHGIDAGAPAGIGCFCVRPPRTPLVIDNSPRPARGFSLHGRAPRPRPGSTKPASLANARWRAARRRLREAAEASPISEAETLSCDHSCRRGSLCAAFAIALCIRSKLDPVRFPRAGSFGSGARRSRHIGPYLLPTPPCFATPQEASWREDWRRLSNGEQVWLRSRASSLCDALRRQHRVGDLPHRDRPRRCPQGVRGHPLVLPR